MVHILWAKKHAYNKNIAFIKKNTVNGLKNTDKRWI